MPATKTKPKTKAKTEQRPAIERMNFHDDPYILVDGEQQRLPEQEKGFDYFLVSTDEFLPHVQKGSILSVCIDAHYEPHMPYSIALVAANNRLEIRTVNNCKDVQVIGEVWEIRRWPGMDLDKPY